jgi:hypothetical protein
MAKVIKVNIAVTYLRYGYAYAYGYGSHKSYIYGKNG